MFLVLMPVIVPFFESKNLDMNQVYLLQAIFAFSVFVCEVPSGYIADLLGRKNTILVSSFFSAIGFSLFPLASGFYTLAVAEVILGVCVSLFSGTDTSLIYDTLNATGSKQAQIKILGKSLFYMALGEGTAALLASLCIYFVSVNNLAWISAAFSWIPFFIALRFVEPPRATMSKTDHWGNFRYIFEGLFKQSIILNLIILNIIFYSVSTLFAVWMYQKYWGDIGIPILYFGYLWAISNFVVAAAAKYAHKVEKAVGSVFILLIIGILPVVAYMGVGLTEGVVGIFFCLLFQICRGLYQVIFKDALNKRVTGDFRATANSVAQMGGRIIFMLFGPLVGRLIDQEGIYFTARNLASIYLVIFFVVLVPLVLQNKNFISIKPGYKDQA